MLHMAVDQEAHTEEEQAGGKEDMDSNIDNDGVDDSKKDGNDDAMGVQKEGGDTLDKNTQDDGQENLQEKLDQHLGQRNLGQMNLGQEHQVQGSEVSVRGQSMQLEGTGQRYVMPNLFLSCGT